MLTTTPESTRGRVRMLALALSALGLTTSCYTLLEHPRLASLNYRRPSGEQSCVQCHTPGDLAAAVRPPHLSAASPWPDLDYPWWLDARAGVDTTRIRE